MTMKKALRVLVFLCALVVLGPIYLLILALR